MLKPRYDPEENVSRHAATNKDACEGMQRKYGWELIDIEQTPEDPVFKVDCVFTGQTEFPQPYQQKEPD